MACDRSAAGLQRCCRLTLVMLIGAIAGCGGGDQLGSGTDDSDATTVALFAGIDDDEPGCSVAVNSNDQIVYANAFGSASLDPLRPFETATVVDIASTSKQFTATAIGLLVIDGELTLDTPLSQVLDDLPSWASMVTISDLLHHTSGIPDYIDLLEDQGVTQTVPADQADAVAAIASVDLGPAPGSEFEYSNSNYVLLADVVEAVTGETLPDYLQREVFDPLDLDAAMTPALSGPGVAESYERSDSQDDAVWIDAASVWTQIGDGAIHTTPTQLASWGSEYWDPTLRDGALDDIRFTDAAETDGGRRYGLGVETFVEDGSLRITHSGSWAGFETDLLVAPDEGVAVAVTCNGIGVDVPDDLGERLVEIWT